MKVENIKSSKQFQSTNWRYYGIQTYGVHNDFPQSVDEIVTASKTGFACLDIYADFVYGMGFKDPNISKISVNSKGLKLDKLYRKVVTDFCKYWGCAVHINYNLNYKIKEINYISFEDLRLGIESDSGQVTKVLHHNDWGRRKKSYYAWSKENIIEYDVFNPDPIVIENQVIQAGGWDSWNGQVLWFCGQFEGELAYPLPKYIAEMTDMRTEEGLANVTGRNVCANFLTAGMLVDIFDDSQNKDQTKNKQKEIQKFQGDEVALQLWYTTVKNKDQVPVFIPFSGENYDKAFTATQAAIPDNIGQAFKQPPILRAKDVGANFGADLMTNAYKYYNSVTSKERQQMSDMFEMIFDHWWVNLDNADFCIEQLVYNSGDSINSRLGDSATSSLLNVIKDPEYSLTQKRNIAKFVYDLTEEEAIKLIPNEQDMTLTSLASQLGVGGLQTLILLLQDPNMTDESKVSALQIIFGLSEEDANDLVNADINIDLTELKDDNSTNRRKKGKTNSGKLARWFSLGALFGRG